jgi:hypothetical protein
MKFGFRAICLFILGAAFAVCGWSQSSANQDSKNSPTTVHSEKKPAGQGKEMGKGGEDIGKGVAKGTSDLAKGTAGSVGNLAHGNVGGAGASLAKGTKGLGENVAVGTGKGAGKIGKGIGGEIKKVHHKSK